ncbi:MAG TPA: 30S ribosomal protein S6 [Thermotogota bacterium]|nr:30S ribosomal protein S6 [Thermotogota bacterium]HRW92055.1 30S ribosomal protein S6 [Thermotogota bacterium]
MRIYEIMFIVDPRIPEEEREKAVEKVQNNIVERVRGTIEKVDRWGIRKLAYKLPKSKLNEGDYSVILFRSGGEKLDDLRTLFQVTPELIRFQIVRRFDMEKEERKQLLKNRGKDSVEVVEEVEIEQAIPPEELEPEFEVEDEAKQ